MSKKEEKAREYAESEIGLDYIGAVAAEKAYKEGWDAALSNQWISVKENQPDPNEMVLCRMVSNGAIVSGYICKDEDKYKVATNPDFHFEDYGSYECDMWMPIPSFVEYYKRGKQ